MTETKKNRLGAVTFSFLMSFPASALNRDDINEPKTMVFNGYTRGRISSACNKRAWRISDLFVYLLGDIAHRTRHLPDVVRAKLSAKGYSDDMCNAVCTVLSGGKKEGLEEKVEYYSDSEIDAYVETIIRKWEECGEDPKKFAEKYKKGGKDALLEGTKGVPMTLDQAFFGRMSTSKTLAPIDGALYVAHAFSTSKNNGDGANDFDYFTCVDDFGNGESAHLGENGYNSNCYYECAMLDLDQLYKNLEGHDDRDQIMKTVLSSLARIMMTTSPNGKQNTFFSRTYAEAMYVAYTPIKSDAVTLANAFANPVFATNESGIAENSVKALAEYIDEKNTRFRPADKQIWYVTSSKYDKYAPKTVPAVTSYNEFETALNSWISE